MNCFKNCFGSDEKRQEEQQLLLQDNEAKKTKEEVEHPKDCISKISKALIELNKMDKEDNTDQEVLTGFNKLVDDYKKLIDENKELKNYKNNEDKRVKVITDMIDHDVNRLQIQQIIKELALFCGEEAPANTNDIDNDGINTKKIDKVEKNILFLGIDGKKQDKDTIVTNYNRNNYSPIGVYKKYGDEKHGYSYKKLSKKDIMNLTSAENICLAYKLKGT